MHFEQSAILTVHNHVITRNPRISVTHDKHDKHKTWYLHITNVQEEDKGRYMCQINTVTAKTQFGYLSVVGEYEMVASYKLHTAFNHVAKLPFSSFVHHLCIFILCRFHVQLYISVFCVDHFSLPVTWCPQFISTPFISQTAHIVLIPAYKIIYCIQFGAVYFNRMFCFGHLFVSVVFLFFRCIHSRPLCLWFLNIWPLSHMPFIEVDIFYVFLCVLVGFSQPLDSYDMNESGFVCLHFCTFSRPHFHI